MPDAPNNKLSNKIRIAFVKFGGLSTGGSEKMLQIIAAHLPKDRFTVDYYYCDSAPYIGSDYVHPTTDPHRLAFMEDHGVNLVKFTVGAKDLTTPTHLWRDTDFFTNFSEHNYDIVQTVVSGKAEYPFTKMRQVPIVEIVAKNDGAHNQYNVSRVMHICQWSARQWIEAGGDSRRSVIVSLPVALPTPVDGDLRRELGIASDTFVYGMHQRPDDAIFSPLPLLAYKQIENDTTAYVLLGGGDAYRKQATELGLKHVYFVPATGDNTIIQKFLKTLDVFAHGRADGEVNSQAMAEAMYYGAPIVSHLSRFDNGHVECIGDAGVVVGLDDIDAYAHELKRLNNDRDHYQRKSDAAKQRFLDNYELTGQIKHFAGIYEEVVKNPFPHPIWRIITSLHYTQNLRIWAKWVYLKYKYRTLKNSTS